MAIRAVQATVMDDVANGRVGWDLDNNGCGVGRRYADCFQDPTASKPDLPANRFKTTLVKADDGTWQVLELCEPFGAIIDASSSFHGMYGFRNVIMFITDAEKAPVG